MNKRVLNKEHIDKLNSLFHFNDPVIFVPKTVLYIDKRGNKKEVPTITETGNLTTRNKKKSIRLKLGNDFSLDISKNIKNPTSNNIFAYKRTRGGLLTSIKQGHKLKQINDYLMKEDEQREYLSNIKPSLSRKGRIKI